MKAEFINNNIQTRKKLFYRVGITLIVSILFYFLKYYFAPPGRNPENFPDRAWFTYKEFIVFSVLTGLVLVPIIISARIVQRLYIDSETNELDVDYIDRFKLSPVSKKVKLSDTQVQIEETEYKLNYFSTPQIFYTLHLRHDNFGHLKISGQDFKNINDICMEFQQLKDSTAITTRQSRLRQGRRRR